MGRVKKPPLYHGYVATDLWRQNGKEWSDHAVYPMCFTLPHTDDELELQFAGTNLASVGDECWGLDNVGIQLLQECAARELSMDELTECWGALGKRDTVAAFTAIEELVEVRDQAVSFLVAKLGWDSVPEWSEELHSVLDALTHDDRGLWEEAAEYRKTRKEG